jgi:hypothetical protein
MSLKSDIYIMLRSFAHHQNSAYIHYAEFCDFIKRYAQHNINTKPQLLPFLNNPDGAILKDIAKLEEEHKITILNPDTDKKAIILISYYTDKYANSYREMENNPNIPYPLMTDLPKNIPSDIVEKRQAASFLVDLLKLENEKNSGITTTQLNGTQVKKTIIEPHVLYGLILPRDMPIILLPAIVSGSFLLTTAISKLRLMLRKEEYHDYFLKKLKISNPGKELSVKSFFTQFIQRPNETLDALKESGETFYFWSQLCYFIRQDYEKVKDYTSEDLSILQSVYLTEIGINYYKTKAQHDLLRETAITELTTILNKPPYYFNADAISKFIDSKGNILLGQYSKEDLNLFLHEKTTALESNNLPSMLTFRIESGQRYYIYKSKVIPLIVRLCTDARETIKENLTKNWFLMYKSFDSEPAMKDQNAFEKRLQKDVKTYSPVLYALLNANFLSLVHYESRISDDPTASKIALFSNGKLLPYSELLMLSRQEIITDAKIMLPFWYTVPIISWIARFILKPSKTQRANLQKANSTNVQLQDENEANIPKNSRRIEIRNAARSLEEQMVEPGSTLDRELTSYEHEWNKLIGDKTRADLTEDIDSLIRDYMRKVIRSLHGSTFTKERIDNLAKTLVDSPALLKIHNKDALEMYIKLYIVKLAKNL